MEATPCADPKGWGGDPDHHTHKLQANLGEQVHFVWTHPPPPPPEKLKDLPARIQCQAIISPLAKRHLYVVSLAG